MQNPDAPPVARQHNSVVSGLANKAKSTLARVQLAFARTKIALNASITQAVPPLPASHTRVDDLTIGSTHLLIIACHAFSVL